MSAAPPDGYHAPVLVYLVEDSDDEADAVFGQVGGFFTEAEAEALLKRWTSEGRHGRINIVPIHQRVEDREYDR